MPTLTVYGIAITMNFKEISANMKDSKESAEGRNYWRVLAKAALNVRVYNNKSIN